MSFYAQIFLCKQPLSAVTLCFGRGLTKLLMQAKLAKFTAAARTQLRSCLAGFVSLPNSSVTIEGIKSGQCSPQASPAVQPTKTNNTDDNCSKSSKHGTQEAAEASGSCLTTNGAAAGVTVAVHIQLGSAEEQGKQLVAALQAAPETVMRDDVLLAAVGMPGRPSLPAAIINLTPVPSNMFTDESRKAERAQAAAIPSAQLVQVGLDWHAHCPKQEFAMMEFSHGKLATRVSQAVQLCCCKMHNMEISCHVVAVVWHAGRQTQAGDGGAIQAVQACAQ